MTNKQTYHCFICDAELTKEEYEWKAMCLSCQDDLYADEKHDCFDGDCDGTF